MSRDSLHEGFPEMGESKQSNSNANPFTLPSDEEVFRMRDEVSELTHLVTSHS